MGSVAGARASTSTRLRGCSSALVGAGRERSVCAIVPGSSRAPGDRTRPLCPRRWSGKPGPAVGPAVMRDPLVASLAQGRGDGYLRHVSAPVRVVIGEDDVLMREGIARLLVEAR